MRYFTATTPVHRKQHAKKKVYNACSGFFRRGGCTPKLVTQKKVYKPQQFINYA